VICCGIPSQLEETRATLLFARRCFTSLELELTKREVESSLLRESELQLELRAAKLAVEEISTTSESQLSASDEANKGLEKQLKQAVDERSAASSALVYFINVTKGNNEKHQEELNDLNVILDSTNGRIGALEGANLQLRQQLDEVHGLLDVANGRRGALEGDNLLLRQQLDDVQGDLAIANARISEHEGERETLPLAVGTRFTKVRDSRVWSG
jgi:chromosome segregation ATPase